MRGDGIIADLEVSGDKKREKGSNLAQEFVWVAQI
jgi:hypothetical protein